MVIVLRLLGVAEAANGLDHIALGIGLPGINHVINRIHAAKVGMLRLTLFSRDPYLLAIRIGIEALIAKIAAQQSELPQMVGDVFAYIGDRAVGAHNYFGVLVRSVLLLPLCQFTAGPAHYPATFILALGFAVEHAFLL